MFYGGHTPSTTDSSLYADDGIPWVTAKDMRGSLLTGTGICVSEKGAEGLTLIEKGATLMLTRSGILKHTLPIVELGIDATVNQDVKAIVSKDPKLAHWLSVYLRGKAPAILSRYRKVGGTVESINFNRVKQMLIPLPSLEEQERIVDVLDRFDALTTSLTEGLPAEIEARRAQYAHYRDRLLAFPENNHLGPDPK